MEDLGCKAVDMSPVGRGYGTFGAVMAALPRWIVYTLHPPKAHNLRKAHVTSQSDTPACNASHCRTHMAQVVYEDPIHHISGKISKKFRTTYNYRKQSERKYTSVRGERDLQNKPYTEKELMHRAKFAAVAAATRSRMADPSQAAADMMAFKAQTKYKTLYRYVFRQEWNAYED